MPIRFRRSVRLFSGLRLNVGKRGVSLSVGRPGATVNIGRSGIYGSAGLPGTGLSYREKLSGPSGTGTGQRRSGGAAVLGWVIVVLALIALWSQLGR